MLAYSYPILSFIWMMFVFFFYVAVFFAVIWAFIDNFRRPDHSGWAKAGWALVIYHPAASRHPDLSDRSAEGGRRRSDLTPGGRPGAPRASGSRCRSGRDEVNAP